MDERGLTEQQRKWFASVRAGLEAKTGRSLAAWAELARDCPETRPRARLAWLKATHGLGQNHASLVFDELADASDAAREPPALWRDPAAAAILAAIETAIAELPGVVTGRRKTFTAWSRAYQFAAARPLKSKVRLGLALAPDVDPRLQAARREGWSERLLAAVTLDSPLAVDAHVRALLVRAHARS